MSITDFISAAVEQKPQAAMKAFSAALEPKIAAALERKYDEVATSVFNGTSNLETETEETDE